MTVRRWALRPGELKALTRGGLLLLAARCAMRAEPWRPPGSARPWTDGLAFVVGAALAPAPAVVADARARARAISDLGARAYHRLAATDEPAGSCANHAAQALSLALEAAAVGDRPALVKAIIDVAKQSASIGPVLAHAGRVGGADPVEAACAAVWGAIRADVTLLAAQSDAIARAKRPVQALRTCAPLWVGAPPAWSTPP